MIKISYFVKILLLFTILCELNICCNSNKNESEILEKYYTENKVLHNTIFRELTSLCKLNYSKLILRKTQLFDHKVSLKAQFKDSSYYITYNADFKRSDEEPHKTSNILISDELIKAFAKSSYEIIESDSFQTHFNGGWVKGNKKANYNGTYFEIRMSVNNDNITSCKRILAKNACLIERTVKESK